MKMSFYSAASRKGQHGWLNDRERSWLFQQRQELMEWWQKDADPENKRRYGQVSESAVRTLERSAEMMSFPSYRCVYLRQGGRLVGFADWFFGSMPELPEDAEFHEGGTAFFDGFNRDGLSFGKVAYLYYVVTAFDHQGRGIGASAITEMRRIATLEGAESVVSDLPLKPFCSRIIAVCEAQSFCATPRIVDDERGNEWLQYACALGGRKLVIKGKYAIGVTR